MDATLRAVADPTRRAILLLVREQEASAGEIAARFPELSRPAVSQHLRVLGAAGLITVRRVGNRRLYRLRPEGLADAARFLDGMWSARLGRLKRAAEDAVGRTETMTIEQTVWIDAPPGTVWRYLTDPEHLRDWWGEAEFDPRPGGLVRVAMDEGPRPVMRGEVVDLVPDRLVAFTFGWEPTPGAPDLPVGSSLVEVVLAEQNGGTRLTLRHSGLPSRLGGETAGGWLHMLRRLGDATRSVG
ncbi:metalloregulator ArsR/SmtB family transcription factor [Plantactinospora sp. GCM10030261]|uniref:metalloregulator ArsR/SmtB family transcription factor n=1 Tax=Plantactinospora sp. GCM10030261 TaxID=3273420 RepID=UPI00361DD81B